ncbi:MAG: hypothetical protein JNN28_09985 [Saprospiraceae bacterium]|nr:hypothetical protein [Saprospiraceae bacterium]
MRLTISRQLNLLSVVVIILAVITGLASTSVDMGSLPDADTSEIIKKDSVKSVKAFLEAYKVLMSPRCVNCHPAGDVPLQGDESRLHAMKPQRGKDGKGLNAMKCANCHRESNTPGLNMPPGAPNWHLPPADMKMVFQGKTAHELAKQLMDPKQNGNKSKEQLIAHATDALVLAAWNPGEGRTTPPLSHEAFAKAWTTWIKYGGYAPGK